MSATPIRKEFDKITSNWKAEDEYEEIFDLQQSLLVLNIKPERKETQVLRKESMVVSPTRAKQNQIDYFQQPERNIQKEQHQKRVVAQCSMSDIAQGNDNQNLENEDLEDDSQNKSVSLEDFKLHNIREGELQIQMNAKIKGMDFIIQEAIEEAVKNEGKIDEE